MRQELAAFITRYHENQALVRDQKGWDLTLLLECTDSGEAVWLRISDGIAVEVRELTAADPPLRSDVVVRAERSILSDILALRRLPSEPYLFGELLVRGPEPDFLRLDYIVSALGGGM